MIRIWVDALRAGVVAIGGEEHHYLSRARRARVGDLLELVDGSGRRATAVIELITTDETRARAGDPEPVAVVSPRVHALVPWIKGDRMELCIEKLVELGVDAMTMWPAERAVVQLAGARLTDRVRKMRATILAAARQSGRTTIPEVSAAESLAAALSAIPAGATRLVLAPGAERALPATFADDVAVASGPEGGLAPHELDALVAAGFQPLGLGPRVLRAETAPAIAVALVRAATAS